MSVEEHKSKAPTSINCKVITVSDTRDQETDKSGKTMISYLQNNGHQIIDYVIVKDEIKEITDAVQKGCNDENIQVILTNGGTGITPRDVTIEAIQGMIEKELIGFGEIFRMLSYTEDIGSAAILSRAIAGVRNETAIFSTPGSTGAVKLAMEKLIIPEICHVVREIKRK